MTFRCYSCKEVSLPGQSAFRVVTQYKDHTHPYRPNVNRDDSDDLGGTGQQIAEERLICLGCVELA